MKKTLSFIIGIFIFLSAHHAISLERKDIVTYVIDGDTLVTKSGERVRLLNINSPEIDHSGKNSEPFSKVARKKLEELVLHKTVILKTDNLEKDKYKRLLAHVYLQDGTWINKEMLKSGLVHIYTFPDNRSHIEELIQTENIARQQKKGIWTHPRWQIYKSNIKIPDEQIGKYTHVSGIVQQSVQVKDKIYLNFGEDWRTDFTVEIPTKYKNLFQQQNINPVKDYTGKELLVRGIIKPINGTLITATHPEQLTEK